MSFLKAWLIRHGQSNINAGNWSPKPAESGLSLQGKQQSQEAADMIIEKPDLLIMSPLLRARETATFILNKWPDIPCVTWPIEEFIYLSPTRLQYLQPSERQEQITCYWEQAKPYYCDGEDAESFAHFLGRVVTFYTKLLQQQGFVICVGHGMFFKAVQMHLECNLQPTAEGMQRFRQAEISYPIHNGEILKMDFDGDSLEKKI